MSNSAPITVASGNGIGPEIMEATSPKRTIALLNRVLDRGAEMVKTGNLRTFDAKPGYALAQGQ